MAIIDSPGQNSKSLYERSRYIGKSQNASLYGIALQSGYKNYIIDADGNRYLDFLSGAACNILGYGRNDVIDAYTNAAKKIQHSCSGYNINIETIELAEKLVQLMPGDFEKKVLFGMAGSCSIDGAIKISRKFTRKKGIISFQNSEHGADCLGIQASDMINIDDLFLENGFFHVPFPKKEEDISDILYNIKKLIKSQNIGGFLAESIQGDAGINIPPKNFFKELDDLLKENDILFMVDEIQTFARTGKWWAIENFNIIPDIIICGKGISAGYAPMSAIIGKDNLIDSLEKAQHFYTYHGHPPSCAATKKVLEIIEEERLMENSLKIGDLIKKELDIDSSVMRDFRGIGLMIGIKTYQNSAGIIGMRCVEHGLYPGYYGKNNEILRLQPPLTLTENEAILATKIINKVFKEMENKLIPNSTIEKYKNYSCGSLCAKHSLGKFE